jgi:hypothetical protein
MDKEIIDLRRQLLATFFEPTEAQVVVEWLIAAEHRRPVLLVGAGFSRNARHRYRGEYARANEVPLWTDVTRLMATHLGVAPEQYDGPTMAEMYVSSFGDAELRDRLRGMLSDEDLEPGEAHLALARYDAEAVVTTNCLARYSSRPRDRGAGRRLEPCHRGRGSLRHNEGRQAGA